MTINQLNIITSYYGWVIKIGDNQIYGSPSDVYAENDTYFMIVDDGNCAGTSHIFHIYNIDLNGKIFEGRLQYTSDFEIIKDHKAQKMWEKGKKQDPPSQL